MDEYVRLHTYVQNTCISSPKRINMRPYRPKKSNEKEDEFTAQENGIELFLSEDNILSRSLLSEEKDEIFSTFTDLFDFEAFIEDNYEDYHDSESEVETRSLEDGLEKKNLDQKLDKRDHFLEVQALTDYSKDLSFDLLEDIIEFYHKVGSSFFFDIANEFLDKTQFKNLMDSYEDATSRFSISQFTDNNALDLDAMCLGYESKLLNTNLKDFDYDQNIYVTGCFLSTIAETIDKGYCPTTVNCACKCIISQGLNQCLISYGTNVTSYIEEGAMDIKAFCSPNSEINQNDVTDVDIETQSTIESTANAEFNMLDRIKNIAIQLNIVEDLESFKSNLLFDYSISSSNLDGLFSAQFVLDKCEVRNNVTEYFKIDTDSCDLRDIFYCKNHYKSSKCTIYQSDPNQCNEACCLEIKMAECAETHCLSKKPVNAFKKVANIICSQYADVHVINGKLPFPEVEQEILDPSCGTEEEELTKVTFGENSTDIIVKDDDQIYLEKRAIDFLNGYKDDRFNQPICDIEPFAPGYDTTKCNKKLIRACIKEGIQDLVDDASNFCPYCSNDNAFDECRCTCCFAKYLSKVCYDPNCEILSEKLRYKRYVREVCETRPIKVLNKREDLKTKVVELESGDNFDIFTGFDDVYKFEDDKDHYMNIHPVNHNQENHKSISSLRKTPHIYRFFKRNLTPLYVNPDSASSNEVKRIIVEDNESEILVDKTFENEEENQENEFEKRSSSKKKLKIDRSKPRRAQKAKQRTYKNKTKGRAKKTKKKNHKKIKPKIRNSPKTNQLKTDFGITNSSKSKNVGSNSNVEPYSVPKATFIEVSEIPLFEPTSDESDTIIKKTNETTSNESKVKPASTISLGKPVPARGSKVHVPKLARRLNIYEREVLYQKRDASNLNFGVKDEDNLEDIPNIVELDNSSDIFFSSSSRVSAGNMNIVIGVFSLIVIGASYFTFTMYSDNDEPDTEDNFEPEIGYEIKDDSIVTSDSISDAPGQDE